MINNKSGYDIFLGGTTANTNWREQFLDLMNKLNPKIKCFNPVVENWTPQCIELENFVKLHAKYHIYVLTPKMTGVYSIAEMIDSVHDTSKKTYFYIKETDIDENSNDISWDPKMMNSLNAVSNMILMHGGHKASSMEDLVSKIADDYTKTLIPRNTSRGTIGVIKDNT